MTNVKTLLTAFLAFFAAACGDINDNAEPANTDEGTRTLHADFNVNGITQSAIIEFPGHMTELAAQAFTEDMLLDIESIREFPQIKVRIAAAASLVTDPEQEVRPVLAEHCEDNEMGEADPLCGWISAGDMSNACESIDCPEGSVCQDGVCL